MHTVLTPAEFNKPQINEASVVSFSFVVLFIKVYYCIRDFHKLLEIQSSCNSLISNFNLLTPYGVNKELNFKHIGIQIWH